MMDRPSSPPSNNTSHTNNTRDEEKGRLPGPLDAFFHKHGRLSTRERLLRVTWGWYPVTMSTGALASLISQQPFTFTGLRTIGKIFFIVDLVLFVLITAMIAARFLQKPRALTTSLHHPSESFFFGAFWVSVALLLYNSTVYGVPHVGPWLPKALKVLFWMYYGIQTCVAVFQYHVIFEVEKLALSEAMPAWILPAYPFLVTGPLAAAISKTQEDRAALQIMIAGVAGQGVGWILAFFIYVVYLTRLINSNMPAPSVRPGMYVSVGPAGKHSPDLLHTNLTRPAYTCAGFIALGQQAQKIVPPGYLGTSPDTRVGEIWLAIAMPAGMFLWLLAIWFSSLTTLSILRSVRRMKFALVWWAFIFPNAGLAIATIQVGKALGSDTIKGVASALTIVLVILWFMCAGAHVRALWRHELLAPGKDEGVDDVNEKNYKKEDE